MKIIPPKVSHGSGSEVTKQLLYDPKEPVFKYRGKYLPHWWQPGKLQFITLRLNDSLPQSKLEEFEEIKENFFGGEMKYDPAIICYPLHKILAWLDRGYGECILKYDEIQRIVEEALLFYDGRKYDLYDYVVMPNHLHFIVITYNEPTKVISNFKRFTSIQIKKLLQRDNYQVWQEDYFDRIIRSMTDFYETAEYIIENPNKGI